HSVGSFLPMMASASLLLGASLLASTARGQDSFGVAQPLDSARVEHLIDSLPLRDRVAQLIMPWIPGNYAAFDDSAFSVMQGWVDSLHVGGIIVSIGSPPECASQLKRVKDR